MKGVSRFVFVTAFRVTSARRSGPRKRRRARGVRKAPSENENRAISLNFRHRWKMSGKGENKDCIENPPPISSRVKKRPEIQATVSAQPDSQNLQYLIEVKQLPDRPELANFLIWTRADGGDWKLVNSFRWNGALGDCFAAAGDLIAAQENGFDRQVIQLEIDKAAGG